MNWARASSAKRPPFATNSSKVPLSITRPLSKTRMRVALRMVESRCAITNVVRPFITSSRAALSLASVTASSALVASSRIRIGGSFNSARALESRCRSPADNRRVRLADAQIVGDRTVEQQRFLKHHADVPPQRRQRQAADVHAVDPDEAGLR